MMRRWMAGLTAALLVFGVCGAAVAAEPQPLTVTGQLEKSDLEGGFYTVGGWALKGSSTTYATLEGTNVRVVGQPSEEAGIWMVKTLAVTTLAREIGEASLPLPTGVTVDGQAVAFDQKPLLAGKALMLPLRAVAEAAGGKVSWDGATRSVSVELKDRTCHFYIGQVKAELNERGVFYIQRNMLPMSGEAVIMGDRTMIPADAVSKILGLYERVDDDQVLDLVGAG